MDCKSDQEGNQWDPAGVEKNAETPDFSPFSSVNQSVEMLPETDIMSIVMKRKLGGMSNKPVENPEKRCKREALHSTGVEERSGHLSANKIQQPAVVCSSDVTISVGEPFSLSLSSFKSLNVEIPTELEKKRISNTQELSLQSTNITSDVGEGKGASNSLHETLGHCAKDVEYLTNDIADNEQGVNLNTMNITLENDRINQMNESDTSESLSTVNKESEMTLPYETSVNNGKRSDSEWLSGDSTLKKVSYDDDRSADEKSHESVHKCGAYLNEDNGLFKGDSTVNKSGSNDCVVKIEKEELEHETTSISDKQICSSPITQVSKDLIKDSNDISTAADEVDSLNIYPQDMYLSKVDAKKSRKQHMPKRVPKLESESAKTSNKINPLWKVIKTLKPEKSRKQNIPKRVVKELDTNNSDLECYYDQDNEDGCSNINNEDNVDDYDNRSVEQFIDNQEKSNDTKLSEGISTEVTDDSLSHVDLFGKGSLDKETLGSNTGGFRFNLPNSLPFHFQSALMSYNSSQLLQSPITSDLAMEKLLENNQGDLTENLEVVKKLREIRYNRYRKISVAEKREIAEFAKDNGVSTAASHFGVSKSAVSMWTRIDFNEIDEDKETKKKNCMTGNQAFMELLVRVRSEKSNKFKGLSRDDKFEVSRYAKLIGVREMARRLDIALGTVSGWMRQFPYMIKSTCQDETSGQGEKDIHEPSEEACKNANELETLKTKEIPVTEYQLRSESETPENKSANGKDTEPVTTTHKTVTQPKEIVSQIENEDSVQSKMEKTSDSDLKPQLYMNVDTQTDYDMEAETDNLSKADLAFNGKESGDVKSTESKEPRKNADEIDTMIAETFGTPNVDQCFEDAKTFLTGTFLENDLFFEKLFKRVVECRPDKYKALKASEKLEVVRYAKRIGVRRIAKILGLATGTLSGWTTKYQGHLGLMSDGMIDMNLSNTSCMSDLDSSLDMSQTSSVPGASDNNSQNESLTSSPYVMSPASSLLDEKSEVTAVKLILKDRFEFLRDKIGIARTIKFRNVTQDEKIEIVKCTKLAGIRPTARVLNMPIGTLSGWITKYTSNLHPVYQEECDRLGGPSVHRPSQSSNTPITGNQSYIYNIMNNQWPGIHQLTSLYKEPAMDFMSENETMGTSLASLCGKPGTQSMPENGEKGPSLSSLYGKPAMDFMSGNDKEIMDIPTMFPEPSTGSLVGNEEDYKKNLSAAFPGLVQNTMFKDKTSASDAFNVTVKSEPIDSVSDVDLQSNESQTKYAYVSGTNTYTSDEFEGEAKTLATDYLQSVYKKLGFA